MLLCQFAKYSFVLLILVVLSLSPVGSRLLMVRAQPASLAVINSTYNGTTQVAPDAVAALFGDFRTINQEWHQATTQPLPVVLGGVSVTVNGVAAPLIFTSPFQINVVVPTQTSLGLAEVAVTNADNSTRRGLVEVVTYAPGIYSANSRGQGAPAGFTTFDGVNFQPVYNHDGSPREVDPGTKERPNHLVLLGTALRGVPAANPADENGVAEALKATLQGFPATVTYAGPAPGLTGIDQVNLIIPPEIAGLETVNLRLVVGEKVANYLTLKLAPRLPTFKWQALEPQQTIEGTLSPTDAVQIGAGGQGRVYYFDAFRFSVQAETNMALELYSVQFDPAVILYKLNRDGSLGYVAADDQTYGLDSVRKELNHALLLTRLAEAGEYVAFVTSAAADPEGIGEYKLRLRLDSYQVQPLNYGVTQSGIFTVKDIQTAGGDYVDAFTFTGEQGEAVQIQVQSTNLDPFVILQRNNGDYVAEDDNSGGGVNAQLTVSLPASGRYTILVTPLEAAVTGNYTIKLTQLGNLPASAEAKAVGRFWGGNNSLLNSAHFAARRVIGR